jgi:hypothetical protein
VPHYCVRVSSLGRDVEVATICVDDANDGAVLEVTGLARVPELSCTAAVSC